MLNKNKVFQPCNVAYPNDRGKTETERGLQTLYACATTKIGAFSLIISFGFLAYFNAFTHEFQLRWDDQWVAMNYYSEGGFTIKNIWSILREYYHGQYAPLNQLYYTTLYMVFGYNPFAWHAGSVILHIANACLIYLFLRKLLSTRPMPSFTSQQVNIICLVAALLFAVHPLNVESVAWIAASKILIYSFFYLLAILSYLSYLETRKSITFFLTLLFFILSFGGKEQAVTMPFCLLLIDFIAQRDLRSRKVLIEKIPFLLLAVFFGLITMWSQSVVGDGVLSNNKQYPFYQRIAFGSFALTEYLTKTFLPFKLSYIYPFPNQIGEALPSRFYLYPIVCGALVMIFWNTIRKPWVLFSALFFLLHIAITLHIIPIARFTITADRYVYMSLIASCVGIGYLFMWSNIRCKLFIRLLVNSVFVGYLFYLSTTTYLRSRVWKDSESLKFELKDIIEKREDYEQLKWKRLSR